MRAFRHRRDDVVDDFELRGEEMPDERVQQDLLFRSTKACLRASSDLHQHSLACEIVNGNHAALDNSVRHRHGNRRRALGRSMRGRIIAFAAAAFGSADACASVFSSNSNRKKRSKRRRERRSSDRSGGQCRCGGAAAHYYCRMQIRITTPIINHEQGF